MKRERRAVIYARVSTTGQTVENQIRELRQVAKRAGWEIVQEFIDHGVSGSKGRVQRPAFDELLTASARREFEVVMAWSVDRLGRSLQHLVGFLGDIHGAGVDLYLHQQGLDTTTPSGRAMFGMLSVFSEFERAMIQERVKAGSDSPRPLNLSSLLAPCLLLFERILSRRQASLLHFHDVGFDCTLDRSPPSHVVF